MASPNPNGSTQRKPSTSRSNGFKVQLTPAQKQTPKGLQRAETQFFDAEEQSEEPQPQPPPPTQQSPRPADSTSSSQEQQLRRELERSQTQFSTMSYMSVPPPGSVLTGKQEHYLKRELLSQQSVYEIHELSSPTALQRFGAPFRSPLGEVLPEDSELPLLRYMFVHHVRNFPFLNQAKEKEFWQDKLQVFLESFANKHISTSEDRLEATKRSKLALKATKLVELMMVSGIPTASGYEERIRFSEMEVVDRGANEQGLVVNVPQGHEINGWDVNVAGVREVRVKRHVRSHSHAEFLIRVHRRGKVEGEKNEGFKGVDGEEEVWVSRRFGEFKKMHKKLQLELPGKVLPPLPRKNRTHSFYTGKDDDDADSIDSFSTQDTGTVESNAEPPSSSSGWGVRAYLPSWSGGGSKASSHGRSHSRNASRNSIQAGTASPRPSGDYLNPPTPADSSLPSTPLRGVSPAPPNSDTSVLFREEQRVSLRAFLRNFLQNEAIAHSQAMTDFLTTKPIHPTPDELIDIERRKFMDERRVEEQRRFFDLARERARELDVHMEAFRRKVIERNGLRDLFGEIKRKERIADLDPEYRKFAEWLRIEVAATLYHLFLAEDNSPDLFAQAKRIHSLVPYGALKQVIRFTNPAAVMASVLDIFMAQPLGAKSLLQRIFGLALGDGIRVLGNSVDSLVERIGEPVLCGKVRAFTEADEEVKRSVRQEAEEDGTDLLVKILSSEIIQPELSTAQIGQVFNAYVAWDNAVEHVDEEMRAGAELYAQLKHLLKLLTRQRDKQMMLAMVEEPTTLRLFRDLFTIFYEPLVRVYKSANVYHSVTDFARFADDAIATIEKAQRLDGSGASDPNQTVQSFIDLCARHEEDLYKFVHEVHLHDNGLFENLMSWIEGILEFLRHGPRGGKLDMNALFQGAVKMGTVDPAVAVREINSLIKWQMRRKKWHSDKTRQKMAQGGDSSPLPAPGAGGAADFGKAFSPGDFGIDAMDLQDLDMGDEDASGESEDEDEDEDAGDDGFAAERKRRAKAREREGLRRGAGEPVKPRIVEVGKLREGFLGLLRGVLATE